MSVLRGSVIYDNITPPDLHQTPFSFGLSCLPHVTSHMTPSSNLLLHHRWCRSEWLTRSSNARGKEGSSAKATRETRARARRGPCTPPQPPSPPPWPVPGDISRGSSEKAEEGGREQEPRPGPSSPRRISKGGCKPRSSSLAPLLR